MEDHKYSLENVSIRYGLYVTVGLIAYFIIMKVVGLVHIVELRTLNFIILVTGIAMALKNYNQHQEGGMAYLKGIGVGLLTSAVAVIPFAIFIFVYLQIDVELLNAIRNREPFGQHLNPYILAFVIAFEGFFSGLILTFIVMQYMKRSHLQGGGG